MTRYLYRGPTQLMDFQEAPDAPERVEVHLVQGEHVELPETDPIVVGWVDRQILVPPNETAEGAVNGPALDLKVEDPPPSGEGAGDPPPPPPPPLTGVAIPEKDAARVRRPKSKE